MEGRYKQISQSLVNLMFRDLVKEGGFLFIDGILLVNSCCIKCVQIMKQIEFQVSKYLQNKTITAVYVKVGENIGSFVTEKPISKNMIIDFIKLQRQE